jgi:hypothetical protein
MGESALKILLDNLDMSRSSLHAWLHIWTGMVVVGVTLEVLFVVWEYLELLHDFRRGIVHPPEKPNVLLLVLGLLGAGLVAVGVAGELYVDVKAGKIETEIREVNERRISLLSTKADVVANKADDLLTKYEAAEGELIALKAKSLPRRLSSEQKELLRRRVAVFATKNLVLSCVNGGRETFDFTQDFVEVFFHPPLAFGGPYPSFCVEIIGGAVNVPPLQIEAGANRQHDAELLFKALIEIGASKKDIARKPSNAKDQLILTIGPKPL